MNNNLDSKLQRTMEQAPARLSKASLKALNSTAEKAPSTRPAAINRPATTQFLNTIAHEQDEVGEALARSINRVNQSLSQASHSPDSEQAPVDSQAKSMAVYTRLAGKLIDRDQGLQEKVAHNLSEPTRPVKTREAAHSLQQAMAQLPERLQEGTSSGKELAKFMVQNLVQLANTKNMGAGLERDLAMRQINVPHHPVNARQQQASSKVLAASINYIKQNQPEVLAKVSTQEPPQQATATSPQPASTTNHERHSVTSAEIEGKTYLDIFKQRSAQSAQQAQSFHPQGRGVPYDEMSAEISQRIHELITKAASNAKSGNLIKLSPEEAANFDRTVSAARERAQGLAPNNTRLQSMLDSGTSTQQPSKVGQGPDGVLPPEHKANAEPVRNLSLSELSARAAKLQQQFRDERQRIVSEGKLPNPAQLPETAFAAPKVTTEPSNSERQQALNHVESNTRELRAALAQAKAALAARIAQGTTNTIEQDGTTQPTKAEAAPKSELSTTKPEPALSKADDKPAEAKPTDVKPADTKHTEAKPADTKLADTKPTDAKPTTAETTAKPTADLAKTETQVKSEAPAKSEVAAKPAPETASKALDLSLLKNTSLNVSYQAVQSTLYGDLDVIPGMTIPVSHFGDLQNEVITPNDKAIEVLKAQARVLAAQQQAQANSNLTELVSSAPKQQASAPAQPQVITPQPQAPEATAQPAPQPAQTAQTQPAQTSTQSAQAAPQVATSGPQQAAAQVTEQAQAAAQPAQAQTAHTGTQPAQTAPQVVTSGPQQAAAQVTEQAQAAAQQTPAQAQPAQTAPQSAQAAPQVVTSGPQQAAAEIAAQAQATAQQAQAQTQPAPTGTQPAQSAPQVVTSGPQQAAAEIAAQAQVAAQQAQIQPAPTGTQSAQQAPQVVTSGPQQAAAEIAAQAAAQQAQMQPAPSAPQPEPQVVTSGPQQDAAEIAAQAQAAAAERAPQVADGPDTIITRTPVAEPEVVPSREPVVSPEPRSVGARYARLYGQMQTGNYDEAQIKHPTSDPLRDKASDAKLRADQSVVLSTLSKLEQLVAQQQQEAAGKTPAEHLSARLNAGATTSQSSVGADFGYAAVPDSGILRDNRQSSGAGTNATFNEESAKIAAATERARAFSVDAKPSEVPDEIASHASATDVKQTKEFLAAQAQEYRVAQDLAQEKEQAQQAAAKFIAEQEAEQEQLERKAAELALEQDLAEEQNEQALTALQEAQEAATAAVAQNAQAANTAPNSVTGAPSLLASQGSSILNPSATDKAGTASDFNRLYREAMQSEAQLRAQQRDAIDQTAKEHNAKVAGETLTLSKQRALEAQAVGSSQVNTVGDTNIRATGATIASATTNLTDAKLGATLTTPATTTPAAQSPASPSTAAQGTPAQAAPTTAQGTAAQATPTTAQSTQAAPAAAQSTSPVSAGAQAVAQSAVNSATQTTSLNEAASASALKVGATGSVSATGATGAMGATGAGAAPGAMGTVNVGSAAPMGLDEDSLQDEIIRNVMRTVPSDDLDEFNLRAGQPLSGVIADTDLTAGPNVSAMPQEIAPSFSALTQAPAPSTVVPNDHTVGAADIRAGQNAPIPEQSVVPSYEAPQEGGLLRRLASLFGRGSQSAENSPEIAQGQTASVAASALGNLKDTTADKSEMLHSLEQGRQEALRQNSLDQLVSRLNQAAANSQLPEPMQQQARKLLAALENPVNDLHTVSSWLNFVTGPLSPSSSLALALHQWAFMLLCIRFEQIGRSVDKFLKKQGKGNALGDNLAELEPAMRQAKDIAKGLDGSKSELTGGHHTSAQLLDDTLGQIERLQQQTQLTPPNQVLPRYIPLPPFYHGGKEGSLSAQHHTDEDGGKSWHLNFHFDLEHMGALEVKVKLRFPEVQISFVAERLDTLQRVQSLMPELNQHLAQMGLQSKGSNARLGHISPAAPAPSANSFRYEGATFTTDA